MRLRRAAACLGLAVLGLLLGPVAGARADQALLDRTHERAAALEELLEDRTSENDDLVDAIDLAAESGRQVADAILGGAVGAKDGKRAHVLVEKALLDALRAKHTQKGSKENLRHTVQLRAARALRHARTEVAEPMRRLLRDIVFKDHDYEPRPPFYEAAFGTLVDLDPDRSVAWLIDEAIDARIEADSENRTRAAFLGVGRARGVSAQTRRKCVKRILALYQSFTFHVKFDYYEVAGSRGIQKQYRVLSQYGPYWVRMRPVVMAALRHLSLDPRTGTPPLDLDTGLEIETVSRFKVWFGQHKRPGASPWIYAKANAPERAPTFEPYARPISPIWRRFGIPWRAWWYAHRRFPRRSGATPTADAETDDPGLGELRGEILPPVLAAALVDPEPQVRAAAALTLGRLHSEGAAKTLQELVKTDGSQIVREAAVLGLLCLQDESLALFFQLRADDADENPRVRAYSVLALGLLDEGDYLRFRFVRDKIEVGGTKSVLADLQSCAVRALGFCGGPGDAALLAKWLTDPKRSDVVRGPAGTALHAVGGPEQRDVLLGLLLDRRVKEKRQVAQCAAAIALPTTVDPADAVVMKAIEKRLTESEGRFAGTRTRLALGVGELGGPHALDLLTTEYERFHNSTIRVAERGHFLLAVGLLRTPEAAEFLRGEFAELDHEFDAAACALALGLVGGRAAIPDIRDRFEVAENELQVHGMVALAMLGDQAAVPLIRDVVDRRGGPLVRAEGGVALALLLRGAASADLLELWEAGETTADLDACATAFALTGSSRVADTLLAIHRDKTRRSVMERAFALVALGRLADPEQDPVLARFPRRFHPYAGGATLTDLARYRDVPFLCAPR